MTDRKYPLGIQTFSRIIKENYLYVDKTDLVWQLAHYASFVFLSRPRRFGKSLLTTTLDSYFRGERQLFEGLKIMDYEQEWESYPVIHLDLSIVKGQGSAEALRTRLMLMLDDLAEQYGRKANETTPGGLLAGIIKRANKQTGKQVVIIIDEYDAPLLDVLHRQEMLEDMRTVMQEFYQPLKASEALIKFCFITGITRLSQLNIFSTLNNLTNISLLPKFSPLCGITEEELYSTMLPDIEALAESYGCSTEEMKNMLKTRYDGYHFASDSPDIYNPYSLLSAFRNEKISNYWFETGTPTFLIQMMRRFKYDITSIDDVESTDYAINRPTEAMTTIVPLLYQSGYLTIKGYDRESEIYFLSIPNQEVRIGYADGFSRHLSNGTFELGSERLAGADRLCPQVLARPEEERHRPGHAGNASLHGWHTLYRGLQEEIGGGSQRRRLLRIHHVPHLLHAQRLCTHPSKMHRRTRGYGRMDA